MKFVNLLKQLVLESKNVENLINTYAFGEKKNEKGKTKKSLMTPEELMVIISNDPTSRIKGLKPENVVNQLYNPDIKDNEHYIELGLESVEKPGDYVEWLISQLRKLPLGADEIAPFKEDKNRFEQVYTRMRELYFEDLFKTKQNLIRFQANKNTDRISREMRDISQYSSFDALEELVSDLPLETATTTKSERKQNRVHPGAKMVYQTPNWDVIKIERGDKLGKEAACFYGGNQLRPEKGETKWCTSAPGLSFFEKYISKGSLFVILPKSEEVEFKYGKTKGDVSGLPAKRYQFHFEDSQFMDPDDNQIDLIKYFKPGGEMEELKEFFKPYFAKKFLSEKGYVNNGEFILDYPKDASSKYAAIYGFDNILDNLDESLTKFQIINKSNKSINFKIHDFFKKFTNLTDLHLENAVQILPENLGDLKSLKVLKIINNSNEPINFKIHDFFKKFPNLTDLHLENAVQILPKNLGDLKSLKVLKIINKSNEPINIKIDEDFVKKFPNLTDLHLENAVDRLPENLGDLKKLKVLAVRNCKNLDSIPESVSKLIDKGDMVFMTFTGSNPNLKVSEKVRQAIENGDVLGYLP